MTARSPLRVLLGVVLAVVALAACDPQTSGAPDDGVRLEARFDTVQNLVPGHAVRIADVQVGLVTDLRLDGYEAVATFLVERDVHVPEGTVASIGKTSLLGENYVELTPPEVPDVTAVPAVAVGTNLASRAGPPQLEEVVERSLTLLGAVTTEDVASLVDDTREILDGREDRLIALVDDLATVTDHYADRQDQLGAVIDGLADTGREFAENAPALSEVVGEVDAAVAALASQRERVVEGLRSLGRLARAAQGSLLDGARDEFEATLGELGPVVAELAADTERVDLLITRVLTFVERIQQVVREDELELYGLLTVIVPESVGGTTAVRELLEPTP